MSEDSADEFLVATEAWTETFPGAVVGALVMRGVSNPQHSATLDAAKEALEDELRGGLQVDERVLAAYVDYYRVRSKTYHVKAQRASVALQGKPIPRRAALVEAMFMAEIRNLVLTAGHDLASLTLPVRADVSVAGDRYQLLGGGEAVLDDRDMLMADRIGIISSILRGPDERTRITDVTRSVLFAVYAPPGIGRDVVLSHLTDVRANVELLAPTATAEVLITLPSRSEGYEDQ
jgi:DNA/RNA-binding domain of Phe-tRNA-synthetase-like protein